MAAAPDQAQLPPVRIGTGSEPARDAAARGRGVQITSRFRVAHVALLGQGLVIGILGGYAFAWSMANHRFGPEGMPILGLAVTPLHGGLLMAGGSLAVLACLGRLSTLGFSAIAAAGWVALTIICAVQAAHHAPGVLGFDPRDTLLYGVLGAYNLALCAWLAPTLSTLSKRSSRRTQWAKCREPVR